MPRTINDIIDAEYLTQDTGGDDELAQYADDLEALLQISVSQPTQS